MSAYVIVDIDVTDSVRYEDYKRLASASIAAHGGRYLVRGGKVHIMDGEWVPNRLVMLEFDDVEAEFVKDDPNFKPSTVQVDHGSLPSNEDEAQRLYHWKVVPPKDTWRAWSFVLIGVGSADEFASGPEAQVLIVDVNGQDRLGHVEFVRP